MPLTAIQREDIESTDGRKPRVLIVDDEAMNRAILAKLLRGNGLDTRLAGNGAEALSIVENERVDLILLDLVMPGMDGFEVLTVLRKIYSESELPIIIVTASTESQEIVRVFKLGANDYVAKPIDVGVTIARIRTHVKLKESQAALITSEQRYALVAQATRDGLWDWDLPTGIVFFSDRWKSMLGLETENVGNHPDAWLSRIHPEDRPRVTHELACHLDGVAPQFETELRMQHSDKSFRWMLCRALAVRDDKGTALRLIGSLTDITEGRVADALTGLPNRALFLERLRRCVERRTQDPQYDFSLLFLDLDNFKLVNDSMGHECGDQLLVSVARRLEGSVRNRGDDNSSFVSRLGGDEFAILLEGVGTQADASAIADRILESVATPFTLGDRRFFATVSVGICISTNGFDNSADMLQQADTAMYAAKAQGKSCFRIFDPAMKRDVTRRLQIENALRHAVVDNQFSLVYQPIVLIDSGQLTGFESLIRWESPELGCVSPAEFIPIAEDIGLIATIGRWVLEEACHQMAAWKAADSRFENLKIGVNLSSHQLLEPNLVFYVETILASAGLNASELCLEITESAIVDCPEMASELLSEIRRLGVTVAIDDFGTGFSSLAYLHRLPLDTLKIDRTFVDKIRHCADSRAIISTIITLANHLNLDTIAEGIENHEQRRCLAELGCRFGQGFHFYRPMKPEAVLLNNWDDVNTPVRDSLTS